MKVNLLDVGLQIQRLRKKNNLSQEQVAEAIDISVNHLGNIENGRNNFSVEVLIKLCDLFKVTPDYIILAGNNAIDDGFAKAAAEKLHLCRPEDRDMLMAIINAVIEHK